jgi:hypothetical protein
MATTQEVDILLKTVADTSGAQQVSQSLQQTQQAATQAQQQLTSSQQGANAVLRALMAQHGSTMDTFQKAVQTISQSTGVAPTLLPKDFGIQAQQATAAAKTAAEATRSVGQAAGVTGNEVLRMGAAFVGAGVGLSAFTAAGQLAHAAVSDMVTGTIALDAAMRANTAALGQQAPGFQAWAASASQAAGVTQQSLLEAGTAAEQFRRQVGLGPQTPTQLTTLATVLGQIRGTDAGQTMNQLSQAMLGNQQAANALGLQLDAATLSYQNFGDATGEVFNQLDPSTQAALRYQAALGQLHDQLATAAGPAQDLSKAQDQLNTQWEAFTRTYGPGVTEMLAGIIGKAGEALNAVNKLNAITLERNTQGGGDEGFKNEQALLQGVGDRLDQQTSRLRGELGQTASDLGTRAKELNDQLRDTTGFDAQATAANLAAAAVDKAQQALDAAGQAIGEVKQQASQLGDAITGPFRAADADMREAAAAAANLRETLAKTLGDQLVGPQQALAAARANQGAAIQEQVRLQQELVSLGADEARLKLGMLPTQQRLLETQNAITQAQIRAQQATLGPSRAQQDLQDQIRLNTLIAQSPDRSLAERQQALASATALTRRTPEVDIAVLQAQVGTRPVDRAAEDVALQARLQAAQQQQALFGIEYQRQVDQLSGIVADAARQAAQVSVAVDLKAINLIVQGSGLNTLTDADRKHIADEAGQALLEAIDQAVKSVDTRGASPQLLAGQPS